MNYVYAVTKSTLGEHTGEFACEGVFHSVYEAERWAMDFINERARKADSTFTPILNYGNHPPTDECVCMRWDENPVHKRPVSVPVSVWVEKLMVYAVYAKDEIEAIERWVFTSEHHDAAKVAMDRLRNSLDRWESEHKETTRRRDDAKRDLELASDLVKGRMRSKRKPTKRPICPEIKANNSFGNISWSWTIRCGEYESAEAAEQGFRDYEIDLVKGGSTSSDA